MIPQQFRILTAFLFSPSKAKYGRQIERETGVSHERVITYLKRMRELDVLLSEKKGKQVFYYLNKDNEITRKNMGLLELERKLDFFSKNREYAVVLREIQAKIQDELGEYIQFILLFGSAARSQAKEESDFDLLFVISANEGMKNRINEIIKEKRVISGVNISSHVITLKDLRNKWGIEPVYTNVWSDRIVLQGEDRFWDFVLEEGEPT